MDVAYSKVDKLFVNVAFVNINYVDISSYLVINGNVQVVATYGTHDI